MIQLVEELAPKNLAESGDNVGLQVGDPAAQVRGVLVALDLDDDVLAEATDRGADLVIVHHPLIYRPVSSIRMDMPVGRRIAGALRRGINVYAAHTNLDIAAGGVNDILAGRLGLEDVEILGPTGEEKYLKIVVFVPRGHEDAVRNALSAAGAGWIGNYSHCTFQAAGTGTFLAHEGADPFLGQVGKLEKAEEFRLETIVPERLARKAVAAMIRAHPYEEVAYDLYPLANEGQPYGLGRLGRLAAPQVLAEFARTVSDSLGAVSLRVAGDGRKVISKVAVCGGAGADLIARAVFRGADVLVTGDVKYHQVRDALDAGLAVVDAGHFATEIPIVPALAGWLTRRFAEAKVDLPVWAATSGSDPFRVLDGGCPGPEHPGPEETSAAAAVNDLELHIHTDGASRNNPGPAGIGVVIADASGTVLKQFGEYLGLATNNVAEYTAFVRALEEARAMGASRIVVSSDSELLVRQINGQYTVKNEGLKGLHQRAMALFRSFPSASIRHVRREENEAADALARAAIDRGVGEKEA